MSNKPVFIPLKGQYYDAFISGDKVEELRLYGPRWNEKTCYIGRPVLLSRGYGKAHRANGVIAGFRRQNANTFGRGYKKAVMDVYGTLNKEMAVIYIKVDK